MIYLITAVPDHHDLLREHCQEIVGKGSDVRRWSLSHDAPQDIALDVPAMTLFSEAAPSTILVEDVQELDAKLVRTWAKPMLKAGADANDIYLIGYNGLDRKRTPVDLERLVDELHGFSRTLDGPDSRGYADWLLTRAFEMGIEIKHEAARALVRHVGKHSVQLIRELEKLELLADGASIDVELVERAATDTAAQEIWPLIDALIAGNASVSLDIEASLRARGEKITGPIVVARRRLREMLSIIAMRDSGMSEKAIAAEMGGNPWAAKRRIEESRRLSERSILGRLLLLADLELAARGGSQLDETTATVRAIATLV